MMGRPAQPLYCFFFNDTATTEIYTFPYTTLFRSLRDAGHEGQAEDGHQQDEGGDEAEPPGRSEEHTSELQSPCNLVWRLLLVKIREPNASTTIGFSPPAGLATPPASRSFFFKSSQARAPIAMPNPRALFE